MPTLELATVWPIVLVVLGNVVYQICSKSIPADVHPLAAVAVVYAIGTVVTIIMYHVINRGGNLLREFSAFYRRTLEGTEAPIELEAELEQTRRYLTIERARFGDDRIVLTEDVDEACRSVKVPAFLVQPIVENAVRHAMREEGPLHIDVQVATDGRDVLIAVADDGVGMDTDVAERLLKVGEHTAGSSKGTGIALRNVADRIERFYGRGSGVDIMSKVGSGTCVTLRLAGANPT